MRAILLAVGACVLLSLPVGLASGCGSQQAPASGPTPAQARAELVGSPAALAVLHEQAAQLLDGGLAAYRKRLAGLRGQPVVVNAWATWCGPCKFEMPYFSRVAVRLGRRVAFLGVNVNDTRDDARGFLDRHWVPYPSYRDPHESIASAIGVRTGLPTTVFYGRHGRVEYVHQGQYPSEAALVADVKRYAGAS
ncbi:MAG TPA: TlpA disulfide reductase family protein [Conexibacter sp.]|nr:TlpA disulfide reductase family protein [Conexibacter sp.]